MPRKLAPVVTSLAGLADEQQLTLNDVAAVLNRHYSSAHELVTTGKIPFIRTGPRSIRVEVGALRKFIDDCRRGPR